MQHCIEDLRLDTYRYQLKAIGTFDARDTLYFNSIKHLMDDIITPIVGAVAIPVITELDGFLVDHVFMCTEIDATLPDFNNFITLYIRAITQLKVADADTEYITTSTTLSLQLAVVALETTYNMKKQRLILSTLYVRVVRQFFERTPGLGGGGVNHARYQVMYYDMGDVTTDPMVAILEQIRTSPEQITWFSISPFPISKFNQSYDQVKNDIQVTFPRPAPANPMIFNDQLLVFWSVRTGPCKICSMFLWVRHFPH
jgi:hypothetical protein